MRYYGGEGVPQDYAEAIKLWKLAAEQGYALAMINLGTMYYNGDGVPQDYVLAHMWFNRSNSNGMLAGIRIMESLEKDMTPQQIEKAQEMARNWKPKK